MNERYTIKDERLTNARNTVISLTDWWTHDTRLRMNDGWAHVTRLRMNERWTNNSRNVIDDRTIGTRTIHAHSTHDTRWKHEKMVSLNLKRDELVIFRIFKNKQNKVPIHIFIVSMTSYKILKLCIHNCKRI